MSAGFDATRVEWQRGAALVAGVWAPITESEPVENPATGEVFGRAARCGPDTVDDAVRAAGIAFDGWSQWAPADRMVLLRRWLTETRARRDLLVEATVLEVGAPVTVAREVHVDLTLEIFEATLEACEQAESLTRIDNSWVVREPVGVVAAITPWNYPFYQLVLKVVAAIAAGCTVVAKPAELTPLSAHLLADAAVAAGLPPGVFNLVPGLGAVVGQRLAEHPGVDLISFTGSTTVGAGVAAAAASSITRVCLELGGKSASVVLEGADFETAVRATVDAAMLNTGQTCSAWTRLVVPAERYEEAVQVATARASELVVGDPLAEATTQGPLASARQLAAVRAAVAGAKARGARVLGDRPVPGVGHFHPPVVVADVAESDPIAREEVFGPVLVVLPHTGVDDAVRIANDSDYGLAGAVWAGSEAEGVLVARRLRTGQVDVNGAAFNPRAPFGGFKKSGYGREIGSFGVEEFTEIKSIQV